MSKKRLHLAIGGIITHSDTKAGEMVVTKEEHERLAEMLIQPPSINDVVLNGQDILKFLPSIKMPRVGIDPKILEKRKDFQTPIEFIEAMRIESRKTPLEDNHPVMEFLEDIIYCPSQIDFYFREGEAVYCLYIRQRHGDTTAQLVPCYGNGEFMYDSLWPDIELSREYDIEGESHKSKESEEQEIIAIEKDCLARLRVIFPDTPFPEHPNRRRGRLYNRLEDVAL